MYGLSFSFDSIAIKLFVSSMCVKIKGIFFFSQTILYIALEIVFAFHMVYLCYITFNMFCFSKARSCCYFNYITSSCETAEE